MATNLEMKTAEIAGDQTAAPGRLAWRRLKKNRLALGGLGVLAFMLVFSLAGPLCSPYSMEDMDFADRLTGPGLTHFLGTDNLGRDVLTRTMEAGRISLSIGIAAVLIRVAVGSLMGAVAGFYGRWVDSLVMRLVDILLCFPYLPLLILLGALLSDLKVPPGFRVYMIMIILGLLGWPGVCRIVRGQILSLREQEFMQAAEALGLRDRRRILRHLLPNAFPAVIVNATLGIGGSILAESAMSFLGLGVMPPTASWGNMIQAVNDMHAIQYLPWLWMPPGICILITVLSINLLGDGLRDALDPKLKK